MEGGGWRVEGRGRSDQERKGGGGRGEKSLTAGLSHQLCQEVLVAILRPVGETGRERGREVGERQEEREGERQGCN